MVKKEKKEHTERVCELWRHGGTKRRRSTQRGFVSCDVMVKKRRSTQRGFVSCGVMVKKKKKEHTERVCKLWRHGEKKREEGAVFRGL